MNQSDQISVNSEEILEDLQYNNRQQSNQKEKQEEVQNDISDYIQDNDDDNIDKEDENQNDFSKEYNDKQKKGKRLKKTGQSKNQQKKIKKEQIIDQDQQEDEEIIIKQRKKKRNNELEEREVELAVEETINVIEESVNKDIESNLQKKAAIERIKSMNRLEKLLVNKQIASKFLQMNGLDHLEKYLYDLPDGSKPSSILKTKLLTLLRSLKVDSTHIKNNQIGQKIMAIHEDKSENPLIKKLASFIIEDWSRVLMENNTDYKTQQHHIKNNINYYHYQQTSSHSLSQSKSNPQSQFKKLVPPQGKMFNFINTPSFDQKKTKKSDMTIEAQNMFKKLSELQRSKKFK